MAASGDLSTLHRVLVTGGSGFLGSHIVKGLLGDPACQSIAIVSRNPRMQQTDSRVIYRAADIVDVDRMETLFNELKPQVVMHIVSPPPTENAAVLHRVNVTGTQILLQCAAQCPSTRAFVYTSSVSAIVPSQEQLTEDRAKLYDSTSPTYPYGKTKGIADALVLAANSVNLRTAVIRVPGVYGEDDNNFVPQLVASIRKNEHHMQVGANTKQFEFCYVGSAASAHILAAKALLSNGGPKVDGEAFFISDGEPQPIFDFARKAYAAAGHPVTPEQVTAMPYWLVLGMAIAGEWAYRIFPLGTKKPKMTRMNIEYLNQGSRWSIAKAKERLGYEPVISQDEAIKRTMQWAMANVQ